MHIDIKCVYVTMFTFMYVSYFNADLPSKCDAVQFFNVGLKMKPEKVVGSLLKLFSSSDDIPWHDKRWYIHHKTIQLARIFLKNILLFIIWMVIRVMLSYMNKNKITKRTFCRFLPDIINLRTIILVLSNNNRVERTFIKITLLH